MTRRPGLLRRYSLPLALFAALAWVFVKWTLPALEDLHAVRRDAAALEAERAERLDAAEAKRNLRIGATTDPLIRERLELEARLSPDVVGPIVTKPVGADDTAEQGAADDDAPPKGERVGDGASATSDT